jgi:hypothetical protein
MPGTLMANGYFKVDHDSPHVVKGVIGVASYYYAKDADARAEELQPVFKGAKAILHPNGYYAIQVGVDASGMRFVLGTRDTLIREPKVVPEVTAWKKLHRKHGRS